jgi:hypothetical protein
LVEKEDVTIRSQATDDFGTWWGVDGMTQGGDRDFAIIADADASLLTPDIGPPGTGGGLAQNGTVFGQSSGASGVRGSAQFAMDFVLVGMEQELIEEAVGPLQIEDIIGGEQWGQAFLPVVMAAFDFAFGLGRGGVAQGDAIEVQGGAKLGESFGGIGKEEGVGRPLARKTLERKSKWARRVSLG